MTCAKGAVIAIIKKGSRFWVGSNHCLVPQDVCPRGELPTGEGYHLCKRICGQQHHAEVDACLKAGKEAMGADLYLIGHYYCCDDCKVVMDQHGINKVFFVKEGTDE